MGLYTYITQLSQFTSSPKSGVPTRKYERHLNLVNYNSHALVFSETPTNCVTRDNADMFMLLLLKINKLKKVQEML